MSQIATKYDKQGDDQNLRHDIRTLKDAHNLSECIMRLESRSADPSTDNSSSVISIWYRSDLQQIRFNDNGTTYKVQATAV